MAGERQHSARLHFCFYALSDLHSSREQGRPPNKHDAQGAGHGTFQPRGKQRLPQADLASYEPIAARVQEEERRKWPVLGHG